MRSGPSILWFATGLGIGVGCGSRGPRPSVTATEHRSDVAEASESPREDPMTPTPPGARMEAHFEDAAQIRDALLRGEPDTVSELSEAFAERLQAGGHPESWNPGVAALLAAAEAARDAPDLERASMAVAKMAGTCGACHRELEIDAGVEWPLEPDPASRMDTFRYAVDSLWRGLLVPSDEAWKMGADAYAAALSCEGFEGTELGPAHASSCGRIRTTAAAVQRASKRIDREVAVADVTRVCAGCHGERASDTAVP